MTGRAQGEVPLGALLRAAAERLAEAGIPSPALDARLLASHVLGLPQLSLSLHGDLRLSAEQGQRFDAVLARRRAREPVGRILGHREFWGLEFALSPDTLEPRPDSETLVEAALALLGERRLEPMTILDLGTGSGCLLVALLSECPAAQGVGVDLAPGALATARGNAMRAGVGGRCRFVGSHWGDALSLRADLIVSNPPYIPARTVEGLSPEVRDHDPVLALAGGADGLDAYRALAQALPRLFAPQGHAVLEIGMGQAQAVEAIMQAAGLRLLGRRRDLGGVERAILLGAAIA